MNPDACSASTAGIRSVRKIAAQIPNIPDRPTSPSSKFRLTSDTLLQLGLTLRSGQIFRWCEEPDGYWSCYIENQHFHIRQIPEPSQQTTLEFRSTSGRNETSLLMRYFRLEEKNDNLSEQLRGDAFLRSVMDAYPGLRIIRQEPWECLISFVLSTACNIPRITRMIEKLCQKTGEARENNDGIYHLFPTPERLARVSENELRRLGLGYRAPYILHISQQLLKQPDFFEQFRMHPYSEAKRRLLELKGVGEKVADCVLLFALDYMEAFPADTWICKIMSRAYREGAALKPAEAAELGKEMFGKYAGLAQQYLFVYARESGLKDLE